MPYSSFFAAGRFTRVLAACRVLSLVQQPAILLAAASPPWHSKRSTAERLDFTRTDLFGSLFSPGGCSQAV